MCVCVNFSASALMIVTPRKILKSHSTRPEDNAALLILAHCVEGGGDAILRDLSSRHFPPQRLP